MKRSLAAVALAALLVPAAASAHATLLRTVPRDGAVLTDPPAAVRVEFDDVVRVTGGNAAVDNLTGRSVLAGPPLARGRLLTLPLRRRLPAGDYSVRWSIVSDDGHHEEGVLAFAVGAGRSSPHSVLAAVSPLSWSAIALRTLYYLGLLAGAGVTCFALLMRRLLPPALRRPLAQLLFLALLAAFLGGSGILGTAPPGTRFQHVLVASVVVALAGAAAAALAPSVPRLGAPAAACSLALLAAPTLSGHALDPNQPAVVTPLADLLHAGAAAFWLGGLLSLAFVLPHATEQVRDAAVRRFSTAALVAVLVLTATGAARAVTELRGIDQLWTTSYGRLLLVKSAAFAALVALGWVNRTFLLRAVSRLRRTVLLEAALVAGVAVAVAVLTQLRPGVDVARALAPVAASQPATLPPRDAVVDARELGTLAVAVARTRGSATVTLLGQDGNGASGRSVAVDGVAATPCGSGCYRAAAPAGGSLRVRVDGLGDVTFALPAGAPDGSALLARVTRAYRSARTIVFDEQLASSPANAELTRFTLVAPDRLAYTTHGGPAAVVIGARRWDRDTPSARWVESAQTPLDVTQPYWLGVTNAHLVAPGVLTFLDRSIPAWFRLTVAGGRPSRLRMTAAAHFMLDRYVGFDVPATVSPPSR